MPETAQQIAEKPEVRKELARTTREKKPGEKVKARGTDKFWFVTHALLLIGCAALYFLLGSMLIPLSPSHLELGRRIIRAAALTALGVGSIIIGLAVQTPMKSFIAWIYILVRQPFRVGDRIKIDDATGDVIDVGYLDTTLWEFGGQYISGDHPTGRTLRFPNEKVLDSTAYNYSWPLFPYIWNEIKFQIAYQSDLQFVAKTMQKITEEELGEDMMKRVEVFRELLAKTPVD